MSEKIKYSVEQLVKIGDAIHDSSLSFIVVANKNKENSYEITTSIHGEASHVAEMLANVFSNDDFYSSLLYNVNKIIITNKI
jgi:hypothetical protein